MKSPFVAAALLLAGAACGGANGAPCDATVEGACSMDEDELQGTGGRLCEGTFYITNEVNLRDATSCSSISGDLTFQAPMSEITLSHLVALGGGMTLNSEDLNEASFPELEEIGEELDITATGLDTLEGLPKLRRVGSDFAIRGNVNLPTCEAEALLASLEAVPPYIQILDNNDNLACP